MSPTYELTWIDKNAHEGPVFRIGRDVYVRERAGQRLIRLRALESYPPSAAGAAIQAFKECAQAWGAPIVFVIDPDLSKPPAVRFLFDWSRSSHAIGSVDHCFMKTTNLLTEWMGKVVLRVFTDGSMPFEAVRGEEALQARLDAMDLRCPREGFALSSASTALALRGSVTVDLVGSILARLARRATGRRRAA